ncbi:hypothetical protein NS274_10200 [Pseudomonas oryzihabitans]|nr:hypothetical protein NS274_10200 [Pseudomonas psychrotolerans]KTT01504.1 hypothetical protein NS376_14445 [Pseudomonas psychrotolerans]KTT31268.1 hypothetical protein NS201_11290 [Pseudomonas psychrotolerans]KTT37694.1 hypothetical protein SB5_19420 [Pseudomonas psychrotolerans]KTT43521.1 hypothetical protein RSA46_17320 [Pseudomonas psychrotolerans]
MRIDSGFSSSAYPLNRSSRAVTPVREVARDEDTRQKAIAKDATGNAQPQVAPARRVEAAAATDSGDAGSNGLVLSEREGRFASNLTARAQQALASYGSTATLGAEPDGSSSVVGLDLYA